MKLLGLPQIELSSVHVSLRRLLNLLNVKGRTSFLLSGAVVPIADVTSLIEGEAGLLSSVNDIAFDGSGIGPHADTIRASLLFPSAGRLLFARAALQRNTAPGVAGLSWASVTIRRVIPGGVQQYNLLRPGFTSAAIGESRGEFSTANIKMRAGDEVRLRTFDGSTGGTLDYSLVAVLALDGMG